jgi:hypothetical protein
MFRFPIGRSVRVSEGVSPRILSIGPIRSDAISLTIPTATAPRSGKGRPHGIV